MYFLFYKPSISNTHCGFVKTWRENLLDWILENHRILPHPPPLFLIVFLFRHMSILLARSLYIALLFKLSPSLWTMTFIPWREVPIHFRWVPLTVFPFHMPLVNKIRVSKTSGYMSIFWNAEYLYPPKGSAKELQMGSLDYLFNSNL